jgi:hypothetical protein
MRWPSPVDALLRKVDAVQGDVTWLFAVPAAVAALRLAQEELALGSAVTTVGFFNYTVAYVLIMLAPIGTLAIATGADHRRFIGPAAIGMLLALAPVPLDEILALFGTARGDRAYVYFFGDLELDLFSPQQTLGESIVLWATVGLIATYAGWRSRSLARAGIAGAIMYGCIQIIGWAWPAASGHVPSLGVVPRRLAEAMSFTGIALVFVVYAALRFAAMRRSLFRAGGALIFGLLSCAGSRLAGASWPVGALKGATTAFAVLLVLLSNDFRERSDPPGAQPARDRGEIRTFLTGLQLLVAAQAVLAFGSSAYLVLGVLVLGFACHHPSMRLKRFPAALYAVSGLAAATCFYFGARTKEAATNGPLAAYVLAVLGLSAVASIAAGWAGTEREGAGGEVPTVYALARGDARALRRIHAVVCSLLALALLAPIPALFWGRGVDVRAIALGGVAAGSTLALALLKDRRRAVRLAFAGVGAYLLLLAIFAPLAR